MYVFRTGFQTLDWVFVFLKLGSLGLLLSADFGNISGLKDKVKAN